MTTYLFGFVMGIVLSGLGYLAYPRVEHFVSSMSGGSDWERCKRILAADPVLRDIDQLIAVAKRKHAAVKHLYERRAGRVHELLRGAK